MIPKLPMSLVELLQQALASHRYALELNEENADILFNTAQVMISLAELAVDAGSPSEAIPLLRESLEVLSACFSRQEMLQEEQRVRDSEAGPHDLTSDDTATMDGGPSAEPTVSNNDSESEAEEQYVTIQADVTAEDVLDTARASLSALTLLVSLDDPSSLPNLAQMAQSLTEDKIPSYFKEMEAEQQASIKTEVALERAEFIAALANAEFKTGSITADDVLSRFQIFDAFDLEANVPAMCVYADALVELASTAQHLPFPKTGSSCWAQLSKAQDLYNRAVKVNDDESKARKAQIYESRGDVELLRFRLASAPEHGLSASVQSSAPILAKNAGTYYRGAANLFRAAADVDATKKAELRSLIAAVLEGMINGAVDTAVAALRQRGDEAGKALVDMVREGLLPSDFNVGF